MAAPNLGASSLTITGITNYYTLSSTAATVVCTNAASSGKLLKVHTVMVANDDGTDDATIILSINSAAAGGGTAYKLAHTITVPADSTLILIDENSPINLEEDRSLVATASAANDLDVVVSYLDIS